MAVPKKKKTKSWKRHKLNCNFIKIISKNFKSNSSNIKPFYKTNLNDLFLI